MFGFCIKPTKELFIKPIKNYSLSSCFLQIAHVRYFFFVFDVSVFILVLKMNYCYPQDHFGATTTSSRRTIMIWISITREPWCMKVTITTTLTRTEGQLLLLQLPPGLWEGWPLPSLWAPWGRPQWCLLIPSAEHCKYYHAHHHSDLDVIRCNDGHLSKKDHVICLHHQRVYKAILHSICPYNFDSWLLYIYQEYW